MSTRERGERARSIETSKGIAHGRRAEEARSSSRRAEAYGVRQWKQRKFVFHFPRSTFFLHIFGSAGGIIAHLLARFLHLLSSSPTMSSAASIPFEARDACSALLSFISPRTHPEAYLR